jgi:hypothetical protein
LSSVYSCFLPARDELLCSCAPDYTLLYHTIPICQVARGNQIINRKVPYQVSEFPRVVET